MTSLLNKMRGDRQGWYKVSDLTVGTEIAVPSKTGNILWDEIVSITPVGREQVYDIEVEGTHNFVGNDIFAHNTAFVVDSTTHNVGIGTTSPYALLSIGNTGGIGFTTATSTFNTTGGINLASGGCFAIGGVCVGGGAGSGTVTSVGLSDSNSSLTIGGTPVTTSGTLTATLNLAHANSWTALQSFANASTSQLSVFNNAYFGATATSTFNSAGNLALVSNGLTVGTSQLVVSGGNVGIGSTTPAAKLSIHALSGETNTKLFEIASSTATATTSLFTVNNNGNVGIGTTTPSGTLAVNGNLFVGNSGMASSTFTGNVEVLGGLKIGTGSIYLNGAATSTFSSGIQSEYLNITGTSATSTFARGIDLAGGCFSINGTCVGGGGTDTVVRFSSIQTFSASTSDQTYTTPANTAYIAVEMWGGGGGGGGGAGASSGTNGGTGGTSCFGTNATACTTPLLNAAGGSGGQANGTGGIGGAGSSGDINLTGQTGIKANFETTGGGNGGTAPRSNVKNTLGGAAGGSSGTAGTLGAGGGGGGNGSSVGNGGGGGGGGSGYSSKLIATPSSTYKYTVGGGGTAGGGGAGNQDVGTGGDGGVGGIGSIIVYEYKTVTSGTDLAENYPVTDPSISAGEIVSFDKTNPIGVKRTVKGDESPMAGIISTQPGLLLDDNNDSLGERPVALAGRVPTKVNMENGPIAIGDRITISSVPGVGMKAGAFDESVGTALEPATEDGSIQVFMNLQPGVDMQAIGKALVISTATSTSNTFDFVGALIDAIAGRTGTTTVTNVQFTNASTTATDTLCLGSNCITDWSQLSTTTPDLSNYLTISGGNDLVAGLVSTSTLGLYSLRSDLGSYALRSDLDSLISTSTFATSLADYAKLSDLSSFVSTSTLAFALSNIPSASLTGTMTGDILPNTDNTYALGSPTNRLSNVYATNINAGDLTFTETTSAISGDTLAVGDMVSLYVSSTAGSTHTIPINFKTAINSNSWGANNIFFNTTGGFGIGIASTTALRGKLDVEGAIASGDSRYLTIANTSGANGNAAIPYSFTIPSTSGDLNISSNDNNGALVNTSYSAWNVKLGGQSDAFSVQRSPNGTLNYSNFFNITSAGNVGIGTTSPTSLFSVHGNQYTSGTAFFGGAITSTSSITAASLALTTALSVTSGGTGQTSFTADQLHYGNFATVATTTFTPSAEFTIGGTIGALVGGANSTLTIATNGIALTKLAQIAANSILGNTTGATGNVTAIATSSLGIALSDTTGTLAVARGGTGQTSFGQGWLHSDGTTFTSSTSPTVNYITATSTTASSTFAGNVEVLGALKVGTGSIYLNGSATSTFSSGLSASALNITGTSATSTFAHGINIASGGGCFAINGTCVGGGGTDTVVRLGSVQTFSSAVDNATYTTPASTSYIVVEVWGGGGGAGNNSDGTDGSQSCFGTNATACTTPLLSATGGAKNVSTFGGAGGTGASGNVNLTGQGGGDGATHSSFPVGGNGGSAPRGGGGGKSSSAGESFGGGGGGGVSGPRGGGGGGGYSSKFITAPAATYKYTVGAGGTGAGGAGGVGGIIVYEYTTVTSGTDLAENYPVADPSISAGEIVSFDGVNPINVKRAVRSDDKPLAGIISTQPGLLLDDNNDALGERPVALSGRVPTKVNLEGGEIAIGDRIMVSSTAGVGMKAGMFDDSVGIALEPYVGGDAPITVFISLHKSVDIFALSDKLITATSTSSGAFDFVGNLMNALASRFGVATTTSSATSSIASLDTRLTAAENSIAALAGGYAGISEGSDSSGLGTPFSIANWSFSSSTPSGLVDNLLKPVEGIEPSVPGIPSPGLSQTTGYLSLYSNVAVDSLIATTSVWTNGLGVLGNGYIRNLALGSGGLTFSDGSPLASAAGFVSTSTLSTALTDYAKLADLNARMSWVQNSATTTVLTVSDEEFTVSGNVFADSYETLNTPVTGFTIGTTTITAEMPSDVLTADGKGVDLYKLATYNLSGITALAEKFAAHDVRLTALETRVDALESGASALESLGAFISKGIAQFGTLIADRFVAATNSEGASSAGTATILAGNTVAQVDNAYVLPSSKIFVTLTASTTGSWYISDKQVGSFKLILSEAPAVDISFDYFIVQTEGQVATSTPTAYNLQPTTSGADTTAPVITLLGDNPVHLSVGGTFVDPGITVVDDTDSAPTYVTFVDGVQQETNGLDTSSQTTHIITYSATDKKGNGATATRSVIIGSTSSTTGGSGGSQTSTSTPSSTDTTPPAVTLIGDAAMQITAGDTFTDPGATATDDIDGSLTAVITGAVDTATAGLYTLTYTATDSDGNIGSVSRVVNVTAVAAPSDVTATSTPSI